MTDPFSLLGVPAAFELDLADLATRHKAISSELHPDRLQGQPAAVRRQMLSRAIDVNAAFRKLKDPITRGVELAHVLGIGGEEEAGGPADPGLLMQMMEWREELRDAIQSGDAARVQALGRSAELGYAKEMQQVSAAFAAVSRREAGAIAQVHAGLGSLRYFQRFLAEQREALLDLDA